MKKITSLIIISVGLIGIAALSCKKSPSTPTVPQEVPIAFTLSPYTANTSNQIAGTSAQETVTLTSTMPSKGISIAATVTDQTNNASIQQNAAVTSTNSTNTVTIISLPSQHLCTVTITVTSVATASNTASQSFTLANKQ